MGANGVSTLGGELVENERLPDHVGILGIEDFEFHAAGAQIAGLCAGKPDELAARAVELIGAGRFPARGFALKIDLACLRLSAGPAVFDSAGGASAPPIAGDFES